jgi:hypothetical protein
MFVKRRMTVAVLVLLTGTSLAAAQPLRPPAPPSSSTSWMRGEGLRADPELKLGTLPNGLRYVVRRNKTPPGEHRCDCGSTPVRSTKPTTSAALLTFWSIWS